MGVVFFFFFKNVPYGGIFQSVLLQVPFEQLGPFCSPEDAPEAQAFHPEPTGQGLFLSAEPLSQESFSCQKTDTPQEARSRRSLRRQPLQGAGLNASCVDDLLQHPSLPS